MRSVPCATDHGTCVCRRAGKTLAWQHRHRAKLTPSKTDTDSQTHTFKSHKNDALINNVCVCVCVCVCVYVFIHIYIHNDTHTHTHTQTHTHTCVWARAYTHMHVHIYWHARDLEGDEVIKVLRVFDRRLDSCTQVIRDARNTRPVRQRHIASTRQHKKGGGKQRMCIYFHMTYISIFVHICICICICICVCICICICTCTCTCVCVCVCRARMHSRSTLCEI